MTVHLATAGRTFCGLWIRELVDLEEQWVRAADVDSADCDACAVMLRAGNVCHYCKEPVLPGERVQVQTCVHSATEATREPIHEACAARMVIGSVGHILRRCSCYVKDDSAVEDPPNMSPREAAESALRLYRILGPACEHGCYMRACYACGNAIKVDP